MGHSTKRIGVPDNITAADQDLWYLVYKDDEGVMHTVKGSTSAIRRSLKEGLLGDASNIRASRAKTGPFEQLRSYPEFRDMIVTPSALAVPTLGTTAATALPTSGLHPTLPREAPVTHPLVSSRSTVTTSAAPHIDLGGDSPTSLEWLKWIMLALVAVLSAVVAMLIMK